MVAYYYPPIDAAGTHRSMNFSRELKNLGWDVTVISCSDFRRNTIDRNLLSRIGSGIRIMRVPSPDLVELAARWKQRLLGKRERETQDSGRADQPKSGAGGGSQGPKTGFVDYLSRLFKTPDSMLTFVPCAVMRALPEMMARRPDVIYSSAPPFSCHLTALCLKSLFQVPWVADFRDPWASNPFRNNDAYPSLHVWNQRLEATVVREADLVVSNTPSLEEDFRKRYPHLDRFVSISNGYDPVLLQSFMDVRPHEAGRSGAGISIVHTGEVYGLRSPRSLITALGQLKTEDTKLLESLRLVFYGKVHDREALIALARNLDVDEVLAYKGHVEHDEALRHCSEADILLLLGVMGERPEIQVPSKIYEYLALRKPILSLSKRGGAIHRLLEDSGVPFLLADLEDEEEIRIVLKRAAKGDFDGGEGWNGVGAFAFDRLALRLAKLMGALQLGGTPVWHEPPAALDGEWTLRTDHA